MSLCYVFLTISIIFDIVGFFFMIVPCLVDHPFVGEIGHSHHRRHSHSSDVMSSSRDGNRTIHSSRRRNKGTERDTTLRRKAKQTKCLKRHSHHASPSRAHRAKDTHRRRDHGRSTRRHRHSVHSQHPHAPTPAVHHHLHEHHHIHHRDLDASDSELPFRPKLTKPRGLAINLGAAPLRLSTSNRTQRKARSKPAPNTVDAAKHHQRPFDLVSYSKLQAVTPTTVSQRFKKRISAPILLPTSKTGSSSISGTVSYSVSISKVHCPVHSMAHWHCVSDHSDADGDTESVSIEDTDTERTDSNDSGDSAHSDDAVLP